jgi:prepilin-type N-terminal cleavage/methylation domain-containing protein
MHAAKRGFTIIELLLTVSIVLVIGTFSVVFFSRFLTQNAVANTQDQLMGQLRKAQLYAVMGKQNGSWGVRYGANTITLFQGTSYASRNAALDEVVSVYATTSIVGFTEVVFAKVTGLPSTNGTYTVTGSTSTRPVVLSAQGGVSR